MAVILVSLTDTFEQWRKKCNAISLILGDYDQLLSDQTTVIRAVNENFTHIGVMSVLTTDAKSNLVNAINEVDLHTDINTIHIGDLALLTTTSNSNLVGAINELDHDIGDLSLLTTGAKGNLVNAINEVDLHTDQITAFVGPGSSLTTDEKGTIVGAINEVDLHTDTNTFNIGDLTTLITTSKVTIVQAINEVKTQSNQNSSNIGDMVLDGGEVTLTDGVNQAFNKAQEIGTLSTLTTDAKTSVVSAINEVDAHSDVNTTNIGTMANVQTSDKSSLVNAINEAIDTAIAFAIALG